MDPVPSSLDRSSSQVSLLTKAILRKLKALGYETTKEDETRIHHQLSSEPQLDKKWSIIQSVDILVTNYLETKKKKLGHLI